MHLLYIGLRKMAISHVAILLDSQKICSAQLPLKQKQSAVSQFIVGDHYHDYRKSTLILRPNRLCTVSLEVKCKRTPTTTEEKKKGPTTDSFWRRGQSVTLHPFRANTVTFRSPQVEPVNKTSWNHRKWIGFVFSKTQTDGLWPTTFVRYRYRVTVVK